MYLAVCILICQGAGIVGALATSPSVSTWYQTLEKPGFTPPGSVFAPVWTTLYTLMGISLFLVWKKGIEKPHIKRAVKIFGVQLLVNALWSFAFFNYMSPLAGLFVIVILWVLILVTIVLFFKISVTAALLLKPYFVWVSFAAILNYYLYALNV